MTNTFFWHDYETFGIDPKRDRPAQFAGIRTDEELNEIGEAVMLYCKPALDYLPSAQACVLTGITPLRCEALGIAEQQFANAINHEFSRPYTIAVGYNSIRFDDEVSRFMFWRNLIDPYAREWQNGCSRWDLLDLVRACYALRPEGISWPHDENGLPIFKLEALTSANGIRHEAAHDALSDVRATIALARLIKQTQPKLFAFSLALRQKDKVRQQLNLHQPKPLLHISGMFGAARGNMAIAMPLAEHPSNKNEVLVWDLMHDPRELASLDAATIRQRLFSRSEDLPEGVSRLPIKGLHLNRSPFVINDLRVLSEQRATQSGIDLSICLANAERIRQLPDMKTIWAEVYQRPGGPVASDVDENLYGGFVSPKDRRTLEMLRQKPAQDIRITPGELDDGQLGSLIRRYKARNFPEQLESAEQQHWLEWVRNKLHGGQAGGRTFSDCEAEIRELEPNATAAQLAILAELRQWLAIQRERVGS